MFRSNRRSHTEVATSRSCVALCPKREFKPRRPRLCTGNRRNAGCLSLKRGFGPCGAGLARFVTRATLRAFLQSGSQGLCRTSRRPPPGYRHSLLFLSLCIWVLSSCVPSPAAASQSSGASGRLCTPTTRAPSALEAPAVLPRALGSETG